MSRFNDVLSAYKQAHADKQAAAARAEREREQAQEELFREVMSPAFDTIAEFCEHEDFVGIFGDLDIVETPNSRNWAWDEMGHGSTCQKVSFRARNDNRGIVISFCVPTVGNPVFEVEVDFLCNDGGYTMESRGVERIEGAVDTIDDVLSQLSTLVADEVAVRLGLGQEVLAARMP